jgi:DNA-binding FrmR family transcriptional regulator
MDVHRTHPEVIKRLRRAQGHLAKVIEMVEKESDCLMIAQQLQAVVNALSNAKTLHVHDHIEHCLAEALGRRGGGTPDISGFKEIAKYL